MQAGTICRIEELTRIPADVQDAHFDGSCPSDKTKLEEVEDPGQAKCPHCGKELKIDEIRPLASDSSAE